MRRFLPPYKKYILLNVAFNFLAMFLTLFSFALIIPILEILFRIREGHYVFMSADSGSFKEVALNNFIIMCSRPWSNTGLCIRL